MPCFGHFALRLPCAAALRFGCSALMSRPLRLLAASCRAALPLLTPPPPPPKRSAQLFKWVRCIAQKAAAVKVRCAFHLDSCSTLCCAANNRARAFCVLSARVTPLPSPKGEAVLGCKVFGLFLFPGLRAACGRWLAYGTKSRYGCATCSALCRHSNTGGSFFLSGRRACRPHPQGGSTAQATFKKHKKSTLIVVLLNSATVLYKIYSSFI